MISHDAVNGSGVLPVELQLIGNRQGWSSRALAYSAEGRGRVTAVWEAVNPELLLHGHMHVRGSGVLADGRRVESMGMNGREGNLAVLDTATLRLSDAGIRPSSWR